MRKYKITSSRISSGNILHLCIAPKRAKDVLDFKPGQYASISYKINGRPSPMRCFSIVGMDNQTNSLEFAVRVEGNFTQSLADLEIGSKINLRGPFGKFVIDEHYDRNFIMIAGGIGITPFMSMLRASTEQGLPNRLTLLYSNSNQSNIPFVNEIEQHEQSNQRFRYALFVTQGAVDELTGKRVIRGRIQDSHFDQLTGGNYNRCTYFICGPRSFINNYKQMLQKHGVEGDRIVTEEFAMANNPKALFTPKDRPSRLAYAITAASLLIGTGFMGTLDLMRYMPRYASAQALQTAQAAATKSTTAPSTTPTSPATNTPVATIPATSAPAVATPNTATTPTATAPTSSAPAATTTAPVAAAPTTTQTHTPTVVTYQPPVTSVS